MKVNVSRGRAVCAAIVLCAALAMSTGCGDRNMSGGTYDEPEITPAYLNGEYAEQLMRDGAEYVFGEVTLTEGENGEPLISVDAKELVEDNSREKGYYIADRNLNVTVPVSEAARITYLPENSTLVTIMDAPKFIQYAEVDTVNGTEKYYHVYIMNGQAELLLAQFMK